MLAVEQFLRIKHCLTWRGIQISSARGVVRTWFQRARHQNAMDRWTGVNAWLFYIGPIHRPSASWLIQLVYVLEGYNSALDGVNASSISFLTSPYFWQGTRIIRLAWISVPWGRNVCLTYDSNIGCSRSDSFRPQLRQLWNHGIRSWAGQLAMVLRVSSHSISYRPSYTCPWSLKDSQAVLETLDIRSSVYYPPMRRVTVSAASTQRLQSTPYGDHAFRLGVVSPVCPRSWSRAPHNSTRRCCRSRQPTVLSDWRWHAKTWRKCCWRCHSCGVLPRGSQHVFVSSTYVGLIFEHCS
jgi:hypothetical protein